MSYRRMRQDAGPLTALYWSRIKAVARDVIRMVTSPAFFVCAWTIFIMVASIVIVWLIEWHDARQRAADPCAEYVTGLVHRKSVTGEDVAVQSQVCVAWKPGMGPKL